MTENLAEMLKASLNPLVVAKVAAAACADAKAKELLALDVSEVSDVAKYFLIVSGRSDRQVQGIANRILQALDKFGIEPYSIEGFDQGHWVLIDFEDVVVHIFFEPVRAHYDLEGLWYRATEVELEPEQSQTAVHAA